MPNRIIKESICTSDSVDGLNESEEVFFYRLLVNCDDYGRMDARPDILRAKCFPLRIDMVKSQDIEKWTLSLSRQKLIILYKVGDRPYLQLTTWNKHQQIRAKKSKFPSPVGDLAQVQSNDNNCNQMISSDYKCPRNPIQSEYESNPNPNPNPNSESATDADYALVCKTYQQEIGIVSQMTADKLRDIVEVHPVEWIISAISEAVKHNARNLAYIESILRNWGIHGFKARSIKQTKDDELRRMVEEYDRHQGTFTGGDGLRQLSQCKN